MMNPLTCEQSRVFLPCYLTGRLSEDERIAVAAHVATCAACRDELAQWHDVARLFQADNESLPSNLHADRGWETLVAQLPPQLHPNSTLVPILGVKYMEFDEQSGAMPPTQRPSGAHRPSGRPLSLAALAVVLALAVLSGGVFALLHGGRGTSTGPAVHPTASLPPTATLPANPPQDALPAGSYIFDSSTVTTDDIWAVGNYFANGNTYNEPSALIVHYQGGKWGVVSNSDFPNSALQAVSLVSADEGWAIGATDMKQGTAGKSATSAPLLLHYLNGRWSRALLPALVTPTDSLKTIHLFSASSGVITVAKSSGGLSVLRYQSGDWTVTDPQVSPVAGFANASIPTDVSALSVNDIWVRSDHVIRHFNGITWQTVYTLPSGPPAILSIDARSDADVWAQVSDLNALQTSNHLTGTSFLHFDGKTWSEFALPNGLPPNADLIGFVGADWVAVESTMTDPSPTDVSYILHLVNGQWQIVKLPLLTERVLKLDSVSPNEAWGVGEDLGLTSQNKSFVVMQRLHYLNGSWTEN